MSGRSKERGFTLVEVIVVVAVIAILAAILTPYITKYIDDSRVAKARNETQVIGAAMASFYKDLGRWPYANNAAANPTTNFTGVYTGPATTPAPTAAFFVGTGWLASWNNLDTHLTARNHNYPANGDVKWNGPYSAPLPVDPWGHPYVVNADKFVQPPPAAGAQLIPVWVMSAGPNGLIDTNIAAGTNTPTLDDIGFRIY